MGAPVVLLTDFGLQDPYVGQMKGALLTHAPGAVMVDLCHQVRPFDVLQASFFLESSRRHFPDGAVFVCVVDPGVGGDRRIVLLEKFGQFFLAPDNGLLSLTLSKGAPSRVRDVTPAWRRDASATFHGRDIFAPLAARLLLGEAPAALGQETSPHGLARLPGIEPEIDGDTLHGAVLHVDRFGNCILNLDTARFETRFFKTHAPELSAPSSLPVHPSATYERLPGDALGVIKGSQGFLELAMNRRSAAEHLKLQPGSPLSFNLLKK